MFGLDATEMLVLVIVGIVVVGPKKLPQMMRTAGQWVAKLRKMSSSLRSQSGIDEILRIEGLEKEMRELRALTRINVMDSLVSVAERPLPVRAPRQLNASGGASSKSADDASSAAKGAVSRPAPKTAIAPQPAASPADAAPGDGELSAEAALPTTPVKPPGEPPPGAIPRAKPRAPVVLVALPGEAPLVEREWPTAGCDAYDALPDDLEEQEAEAAAAEAAAAAAAATGSEAGDAGEVGEAAAGEAPAAPAANGASAASGHGANEGAADPAAKPPAAAEVT